MEQEKIEIRCKTHKCNRLLMNYYVTGENVELNLQGFEIKCEKCKRVLQLTKYTEKMLQKQAVAGVFRL